MKRLDLERIQIIEIFVLLEYTLSLKRNNIDDNLIAAYSEWFDKHF